MNKTAIRNFAVWARNKLINDVTYRAGLMGVTANGIADPLPQSTDDVQFFDIGMSEPYQITGEEIKQRKSLVEIIERKEKDSDYATAFTSVVEEVAYTWFNRLIAIRFMEVNDYLPSHIRVLSSESGKLEPDLVTTPYEADLFFANGEEQIIQNLKNENKLDEVFRMLFIKQCNALYENLPRLFENLSDYTELLLNVSFIDQEGVVYHLVHDIPEEDFNVELGGQVEIIGWLYQYYNAELKDETFDLLKKNVKVTKERIPAATQLFTPDWIVRYMVENSLGSIWAQNSHNTSACEMWDFYLGNVTQTDTVSEHLEEFSGKNIDFKLEEIKIIDPCMGSGHILVYAFDLLMQIYTEAGWTQRDAAISIINNNIYGLDIDDRAAQLAYFAIMMKARQYNRRVLTERTSCNLIAIQESNGFDRKCLSRLGELQACGEELIAACMDAKEYGSLLNIKLKMDQLVKLEDKLSELSSLEIYDDLFAQYEVSYLEKELRKLIIQAKMMIGGYHSVITNPPYMGNANMSNKLSNYVKENYSVAKTDLYSAFVQKCISMTLDGYFCAFMTSYTWMYISSFEEFRKKLIENHSITTLIQPEYHSFFESANVPICSFVVRKNVRSYKGIYVDLGAFYGAEKQEKMLRSVKQSDKCEYKYISSGDKFIKIKGCPIAYSASDRTVECFESNDSIGSMMKPKQGLATADNERFIRTWQEVMLQGIELFANNGEDAEKSGKKWFPFNKGGDFRRWYGNRYYVVNWEKDGYEIKNQFDEKGKIKSRPQNTDFYFKHSISCSAISSAEATYRYYPPGCIFDVNFRSMFCEERKMWHMLALMNSKIIGSFNHMLNPTLALNANDIERIPVAHEIFEDDRIADIAIENVEIAKRDWNSFETSMDFKKHPLI